MVREAIDALETSQRSLSTRPERRDNGHSDGPTDHDEKRTRRNMHDV